MGRNWKADSLEEDTDMLFGEIRQLVWEKQGAWFLRWSGRGLGPDVARSSISTC